MFGHEKAFNVQMRRCGKMLAVKIASAFLVLDLNQGQHRVGPSSVRDFAEGSTNEIEPGPVLMAEQNFRQATHIADRGYILVRGKIAYTAHNAQDLQKNDLMRQFHLGARSHGA